MFSTLRLRNKDNNKRMSRASKGSRVSRASGVGDEGFVSIFGDKRTLNDAGFALSNASSNSNSFIPLPSPLICLPPELKLKIFDYL